PAEHLSQRGEAGALTQASDLQADAGQCDQQVYACGEVVAADHRSSKNQPKASQAESTTDRPRWDASTGSVRTLSVGWAYESVVKEGWSRSWVSSQSDAVTNNAVHATAPTGPSGAGSSAWLRPRHPMAMARAATRATGTVAGHE